LSKIYDDLRSAEKSRVPGDTRVSGGPTATVASGLRVKGNISGNEDLQVDGTVEGPVQLGDGKLVVGATGKLTGDIVAREIVIHGSVKGNLRSSGRIEIKTDGSLVGDVSTPRITIEDGAYFKGSIEIDRKIGEAAVATAPSGAGATSASSSSASSFAAATETPAETLATGEKPAQQAFSATATPASTKR
jgi:cytoskeletal protein CcmA (bactofilin family)